MSEQTIPTMFIVKRPMYHIVAVVNGYNIDIDIRLTSKGRRYAGARARGFHHFMRNDDDALAEILHARDNFYPPEPRPAERFNV